MNAALPVQQVGLGQPREFDSPATAENTPREIGAGTQLIYEEEADPDRLYITTAQPLKYVQVKTRMGIETVSYIDKQKFFCLRPELFIQHAHSISVRVRQENRDGKDVDVTGKVIVSDIKGNMVARFSSTSQAKEHFAKLKKEHNYDGLKLKGAERLNTPDVTDSKPRMKKGQLGIDQMTAIAVAAVMAADKQRKGGK